MSEAEVEKRVREVVVARFYSLAKVNLYIPWHVLCYGVEGFQITFDYVSDHGGVVDNINL